MQSDYEDTCRAYKKLIMEVVNTQLLPPADYPYWHKNHADYFYWRERYKEVKNPWGDIGVEHVALGRIKNIDEEFKEVMARLDRIGGAFLGYDIGGGCLAKNFYNVLEWIDNIKRTKRLANPLDIKNAILQKMDKQERKKGLILEAPALDKNVYTTKELCKMLNLSDSRFSELKAEIEGFPEPDNPEGPLPFYYSRDKKKMILTIVPEHRSRSKRTPPLRGKKQRKSTKKR